MQLSYFSGIKNIPDNWNNSHVEEIYNYLISRGYRFKLFKELSSSKYILSIGNHVAFYYSAKQFCLDYLDLYFKEKEEEEIQFFKDRNQKALKQKNLIKEVLTYAKEN